MGTVKRSVLWISELLISLFKFWIKNPWTLPLIFIFFIKKLKYIPFFLHRNTAIEQYSNEFGELLKQTVDLYKERKFNPKDKRSYDKLKKDIKNPYQILYFLVRKLKPKIIVETGVASGVSSGFILQAIRDNKRGKLYSIDLPFQWYVYEKTNLHLDSLPAGKLPGYLIPQELKKNWKLIIGDTYEKLPKLLKRLERIDMFFHDSEHTFKTMMFEYEEAWAVLNKKGILISDDINFTPAFRNFAKKKKSQGIIFKYVGIVFK